MSGEYEVPDNTPIEIPTRLRLPQSRTDQIRAFIRQELSRRADDDGHETFEEADDIEPDEEGQEPYTRYELMELEPPVPPEKPPEAEGPRPADPVATPEGKPPAQQPETTNG